MAHLFKVLVVAGMIREFDAKLSTNDGRLNAKSFASLSKYHLKEHVSSQEKNHCYTRSAVESLSACPIQKIAIRLYMLGCVPLENAADCNSQNVCLCWKRDFTAHQLKEVSVLWCPAGRKMGLTGVSIGSAGLTNQARRSSRFSPCKKSSVVHFLQVHIRYSPSCSQLKQAELTRSESRSYTRPGNLSCNMHVKR